MLVISPPSIFLKEHSVWRSSLVTRMISSGWLLWTDRDGIGGRRSVSARCSLLALWVSKAARELEAEWVQVKAFPMVTYPTFLWLGLEWKVLLFAL